MGLVQIEQSELDTLRKERDDARADAQAEKERTAAAETAKAEAEQAAEAAEAAKVAAETAKTEAETALTAKNEELAKAELKETRIGALGSAFTAKIDGMPTVKARLTEQAQSMSDEDWETRLKELEEVTAIKRDAKKDGDNTPPADPAADPAAPTFGREELASIAGLSGDGQPAQTGGVSAAERSSVVGSLASAFGPKKSD